MVPKCAFDSQFFLTFSGSSFYVRKKRMKYCRNNIWWWWQWTTTTFILSFLNASRQLDDYFSIFVFSVFHYFTYFSFSCLKTSRLLLVDYRPISISPTASHLSPTVSYLSLLQFHTYLSYSFTCISYSFTSISYSFTSISPTVSHLFLLQFHIYLSYSSTSISPTVSHLFPTVSHLSPTVSHLSLLQFHLYLIQFPIYLLQFHIYLSNSFTSISPTVSHLSLLQFHIYLSYSFTSISPTVSHLSLLQFQRISKNKKALITLLIKPWITLESCELTCIKTQYISLAFESMQMLGISHLGAVIFENDLEKENVCLASFFTLNVSLSSNPSSGKILNHCKSIGWFPLGWQCCPFIGFYVHEIAFIESSYFGTEAIVTNFHYTVFLLWLVDKLRWISFFHFRVYLYNLKVCAKPKTIRISCMYLYET